MPSSSQLLVFTDLDGSLLDHHSYDWSPAGDWLTRLQLAGVPVVIDTSKTAAEVGRLVVELGLEGQPFVVENGAAIHLPPAWRNEGESGVVELGGGASMIRATLVQLRERYGFRFEGFGDVDAAKVAQWTGLALEDAERASRRDASEPLRWLDDEGRLDAFAAALAEHRLVLTRGGRFHHVMAAGVDKGRALVWLVERYRQRFGGRTASLALGDGANDLPMLAAADRGVLIRTEGAPLEARFDRPERVYLTRESGPKGWREGMDHWLGEDWLGQDWTV